MRGKKFILFIIIAIIMSFNLQVQAESIKELPPYVEVSGINEDIYDVNKKITQDEVIVTLKQKNSDLSYSWTFQKSELTTDLIKLNFELDFVSPNKEVIDELTHDVEKTYLSFQHHGNLPSRASIHLYVGNKYKNGQKLYLYYYNDENDTIEYIAHNIKVINGYIDFEIDHCSDYILTTTIVNDAVNNPKNMNYIIVGMVVVVIGLAAVTVFKTKR